MFSDSVSDKLPGGVGGISGQAPPRPPLLSTPLLYDPPGERSRPRPHDGPGGTQMASGPPPTAAWGQSQVQEASCSGAPPATVAWSRALQVCRYWVEQGARTFRGGPLLLCVLAGPGGCRTRPLGFEEHGPCVLGLTFKNGQASTAFFSQTRPSEPFLRLGVLQSPKRVLHAFSPC